jgi:hypothetical protein
MRIYTFERHMALKTLTCAVADIRNDWLISCFHLIILSKLGL